MNRIIKNWWAIFIVLGIIILLTITTCVLKDLPITPLEVLLGFWLGVTNILLGWAIRMIIQAYRLIRDHRSRHPLDYLNINTSLFH